MAKKILLINPNFYHFPGWLEAAVNYRKPPLGLAYLAAHIRNKYPADIRIYDAHALNKSEDDVARYAETFAPDIVGITVVTPTLAFARKAAIMIRRAFPQIPIIFGGPHVSALPFENLDVADVCVIGEGEETFLELVQSYSRGSGLREIKGIAFKENGRIVKTDDRGLIEDLDTISFPARDLLPQVFFTHVYPYPCDTTRTITLITSRGCNFKCNFCANEFMWKGRTRYRSLDNVFAEIEHLVGHYRCGFLYLYDDNFTSDPARVIEFSRRKRKYFPKLKWFCYCRADSLSNAMLEEMKAAGCAEVQVGVESGDDDVLAGCNKRMKTETVSRAFQLLKQNKINQWATFIIGNQNDTRSSIEKTIRFALKLDPTYVSFMFLSPLPGTESFRALSAAGAITTYNWSEYNWHKTPVFQTAFLSREMMIGLRKKAYFKFYLRPQVFCRYLYALVITGRGKIMLNNLTRFMKLMLGLHKKTIAERKSNGSGSNPVQDNIKA